MDQHDRRLSERIRAALGQIIEQDLADPRVRHVTITDVRAHTDADVAKVFVTSVDPNLVSRPVSETGGDAVPELADAMEGLESAAGHIRKLVAERLDLRRTPKLVFAADPLPEKSSKVDELIRNLNADS